MPAIDLNEGRSPAAGGSADRVFNVTPSDGAELPFVTLALYVGGAGDVAVKDRASGDTVIFKNVSSGSGLPIRVARVLATGTTATGIVGLA